MKRRARASRQRNLDSAGAGPRAGVFGPYSRPCHPLRRNFRQDGRKLLRGAPQVRVSLKTSDRVDVDDRNALGTNTIVLDKDEVRFREARALGKTLALRHELEASPGYTGCIRGAQQGRRSRESKKRPRRLNRRKVS